MKCPFCGGDYEGDKFGIYRCSQCGYIKQPYFTVRHKPKNQQKETDMRYNNMVYAAKAVKINDDGAIVEVLGTLDDIIANDAAEARDKALILFAKKLEVVKHFEVLVSPFV